MKKIFIFFILFLLLIGLFITLKKKQDSNNKEAITYQLNNRNYRLFTAKNPQEWEKGLMYYRKLDEVDGMIFIFPSKQIRSFWNKNTLMDLDLYWLNNNDVIGKSYLPSIEKSKEIVIVSSPDKANRVIELQAGK